MSKYNVRKKAQIELDIREGGIAQPIANNMWYIHGRKHEDGGVTMGPNNKNGVEVEGGEVVEMIDSNHPSVGRQFAAGGQNQTMRVFSSVPFLRGVSPAQLVMEGANPDKVFKAQEDFKDRNRINDDGTRYEIGGEKIIHINDLPSSFKGQLRNGRYVQIGVPPITNKAKSWNNTFKDHVNSLNVEMKNFIIDGIKYGKQILPKPLRKYYARGINILNSPGVEGINNTAQKITQIRAITDEKKAGGIYIKPSKRGTFTAAATKHGMGIQEFASKVLANKEDYSSAMVKKANFARNASRWKKEYGGDGNVLPELVVTPRNSYGKIYDASGINKRKKIAQDALQILPFSGFVNDVLGFTNPINAGGAVKSAMGYGAAKARLPFLSIPGIVYNGILGLPDLIQDVQNLYKDIKTPKEEFNRKKKEYGGSMIYIINGNVKNGLSLRSKAKYGTIDKNNKDVKVGQDGLIYKRAADGEWYTDGTVHVAFKKIKENKSVVKDTNNLKNIKLKRVPESRVYLGEYNDEEEKETKKIGSLTYEKNEDDKWVPSAKQSTTITRDGGRPKDFGMTRTGVNHPNGSYKYHPLTGEKISEIGVVETSEPSVKGATKASSKSSSTARGRGTKASTPKAAARTTTKGADVKYGTPLKEKKESLYITGIKNNSITPLRAGMEKIKSPSSTGDGTQSKDGRWIGQYKTTNVGDWIGLGSNLAGTIASYFMTKNAINKMPEPLKPVMTPAVKLKTKYNIQPQLTNISEAEQVNRATVRRNTQSSNTSLAREQRLMNEARGARNTLYGQKENIETQLINQDRLNRQSVMRDNVRAYNEYLNKVTATKMAQNEMRASNINNLISGLTGSVNSILGNIESRRATNNTLRAIAAANPNVDARLIGGFDYYIDPITKKKYNKNQQYVGTING